MTDDKKKGIPTKKDVEDEIVDLDICAEKSLHRPLKIRVQGKIYHSAMLTADLFEECEKLQRLAEEGDQKAAFKQIDMVFKVPRKALNSIDLRDVGMIPELILKAIQNSEPYRTGQEKKVEGPGKQSSSS